MTIKNDGNYKSDYNGSKNDGVWNDEYNGLVMLMITIW